MILRELFCPGAEVIVGNRSIGIERKIMATGEGYFLAPSLPPADGYTVSVTATGFRPFTSGTIAVHVGETISLPVVNADKRPFGGTRSLARPWKRRFAFQPTRTSLTTLLGGRAR